MEPKMNTLKLNGWSDIPESHTGIVEHHNGNKEYLSSGLRHRVDGPAIENFDGDKHWYLNGQRHRVDGPASEYCYYDDDGNHVYSDYEWYLNGVNYSQEVWFEKLSDEDKLEAIWNLR
jgi:hypothetical protein